MQSAGHVEAGGNAPLVLRLVQDEGDQYQDEGHHHQRHQTPEQEPVRAHAASVAQDQEAPPAAPGLPSAIVLVSGQREHDEGQQHAGQQRQWVRW